MYRLDELGWLGFQDFCARLLEHEAGLRPDEWTGEADRLRTLTTMGDLRVPGSDRTFRGR